MAKGNGAVKINLEKTANGKLAVPEDEPLELEIGVQRHNVKTFKTFNSEVERVRFIVQPWFKYIGDNPKKIKIVYPLRPAYKGK